MVTEFSGRSSSVRQIRFLSVCAVLLITTSIYIDSRGLPFVDLGYSAESFWAPFVKAAVNIVVMIAIGAYFMFKLEDEKNDMTDARVIDPTMSVHMAYLDRLLPSGRKFEILAAEWYDYYRSLDDVQKHALWADYLAANRRSSL
jgi:hypothetical protein